MLLRRYHQTEPAGEELATAVVGRRPRLNLEGLQAKAAELGLSTEGTKAELADRIKAAGEANGEGDPDNGYDDLTDEQVSEAYDASGIDGGAESREDKVAALVALAADES